MTSDWITRLQHVEAQQRDLARGVFSLERAIRALREELEAAPPTETETQSMPPEEADVELRVEDSPDTHLARESERLQEPPPLPVVVLPAPQHTAASAPSPASEAPGSFELKVGRVWFVRIGVTLLLTGMVFLANYAYREWVMNWGAFPRALMLFLGSGAMVALGFGIERKRPAMTRFGQVLEAGGLAGVFYTLYASHFVEPLRWIESGLATGGLLLAWTGFMTWIADRRKSEFLAGFSLLLAYYTCVVTPISGFLLFANLLLTGASVFFLIRNRWRTVALGALPVTYGAFAFWQYGVAGAPGGPAVGVTALGYLACYWLVFTLALFLARRGEMGDGVRPAWVALNNIALFALGAFALPGLHGDWFWVWSLGLGTVFLLLSYGSARALQNADAVSRVYLAEGLILASLGLIARFTGSSLMLVLVAESVALLIASRFHWTSWYRAAAYIVALVGTGVGVESVLNGGAKASVAALAAVAFLVGEGFSLKTEKDGRGGSFGGYYFALLALGLFGTTAYGYLPSDRCVIVFAMLPVAAIATVRVHWYRELAIGSLAMLVAGHLLFTVGWIEDGSLPLWCTASLFVLTIACAQIWQRQTTIIGKEEHREYLQFYLAAVEVALPALMLYPTATSSDWIVYGVLIAAGFYAKGTIFGSGWSAALGQGYLVFAGMTTIVELGSGSPHWLTTLLPALAMAGFGLHSRMDSVPLLPFWGALPVRGMRIVATALYPVGSIGLVALWTLKFTGDGTRALAFAGIASAMLGYALWRKSRFAIRNWAVFALIALAAAAWIGLSRSGFGVGDVAAVLVVLAGQHFVRRDRELLSPWVPVLLAALGLLIGWWMVTRIVGESGSGLYLTVGWCLYGATVLAAGFVNRQRIYRLAGLGLLAATGARLMFVDLWAYGTLARILGFLSLGFVLVVVGFVYNRFSETIRKFL